MTKDRPLDPEEEPKPEPPTPKTGSAGGLAAGIGDLRTRLGLGREIDQGGISALRGLTQGQIDEMLKHAKSPLADLNKDQVAQLLEAITGSPLDMAARQLYRTNAANTVARDVESYASAESVEPFDLGGDASYRQPAGSDDIEQVAKLVGVVGAHMETLIELTSASRGDARRASEDAKRSDRSIRWLTVILVLLTAVLAIPVFKDDIWPWRAQTVWPWFSQVAWPGMLHAVWPWLPTN